MPPGRGRGKTKLKPFIPTFAKGVELVFVNPEGFEELLNERRYDDGMIYKITSWGFDPMDDSHLSPSESRRHIWVVWEGR